MGLKVHINHQAEFDELTKRYACFNFLRNINISNDEKHRWYTNSSYWGYDNQITYEIQAMIIGKTGYGKSTTLNRLVGSNVFETDDVNVCTKDLYCSMYRINKSIPSFFTISDLPGVGESNYADDHYYKWYKDMLNKSDVVLYVLRADQRDYAVDEMIFKNLFENSQNKQKVFIALNYADKIEPINRTARLSSEQINNLQKRINEISRIFSIDKNDIVYYSASDGINFDNMVNKIAEKLKQNLNVRW